MTNLAEISRPHRLDRIDDTARAVLFTAARTANEFDDAPVTDAQLRSIWDLAKWPPSALNFQPLRALYVQSREARERLVSHMSEGNQAKTLAAPAVAVLAMDREFHQHIATVAPHRAELKDVFDANESFRGDAARNNSWLQAGYFLLAVRAEGLAAGPMGGFDPAAIDADFFPDGRWGTFMVVNIGHPSENAYRDRLPRLEHEDVLRWA